MCLAAWEGHTADQVARTALEQGRALGPLALALGEEPLALSHTHAYVAFSLTEKANAEVFMSAPESPCTAVSNELHSKAMHGVERKSHFTVMLLRKYSSVLVFKIGDGGSNSDCNPEQHCCVLMLSHLNAQASDSRRCELNQECAERLTWHWLSRSAAHGLRSPRQILLWLRRQILRWVLHIGVDRGDMLGSHGWGMLMLGLLDGRLLVVLLLGPRTRLG